jgi:hypothetical protein
MAEEKNVPPANPVDQARQNGHKDKMDGHDFLSHLRAAGAFAGNKDDTSGSNRMNNNHRQDLSSLSEYFSNDESAGNQNNPCKSPTLVNPVVAEARDTVSPLPPSPPPKPDSLHQHSRSVSWGQNNTQEYHDDDVSSLGTGHNRRITLEDLNRHGPFVEEAESNILRAWEQQSMRDLRPRTDSEANSTILGSVPDSTAHDFSLDPSPDEHQQRDKEEDRIPLIRPHRRTQSVEATLAGLTDAMHSIHIRRSDSEASTVGSDGSEHDAASEAFGGTARKFAKNVEKLHEEDGARRKQARSRWNFLLENIHTLKEEVGNPEENADDDRDSKFHGDIEDQDTGREEDSDDYYKGISQTDSSSKPRRRGNRHRSTVITGATDKFKEDLEVWRSFFRPRKSNVMTYIKTVLFYLIIPLCGISALLFYVFDNPIHGKSEDGSVGDKPSVSWWLLFATRQVITFSLSLAMQGKVLIVE